MTTARFALPRSVSLWHALATTVLLLTAAADSPARAAIVYFPVNSGGSISQPAAGQQPVYVTVDNINLSAGTFTTTSSAIGSGTTFGVGLNPTDAPSSQYFFTQSNNSIGWLVPAGTVSLLSAGATITSGSYSSGIDPNFGADWRAGVAPGYAGLQLTSGTDVYYGWASINYVVGSPNQATVTAFAFENTPNTPITAAAVPEPTSLALVATGVAFAAAVYRRRSRLATATR